MPAPANLAEFLASGPTLQVDPLVSLPTSLDPATWITPPWADYAPLSAVAVPTVQLPGGLMVNMTVDLRAGSLAWEIVALGVSYAGSGLFIAVLSPPIIVRQDFTARLSVQAQVNPVQS